MIDKFARSIGTNHSEGTLSWSQQFVRSCLGLGGTRGEPEKGELRSEEYLFALSSPLIFYFSFHSLHM